MTNRLRLWYLWLRGRDLNPRPLGYENNDFVYFELLSLFRMFLDVQVLSGFSAGSLLACP